MPVVSMKELLEAGVHFGHHTRRWNPKMRPYIFTERNGIHIIDLQQTLTSLEAAYEAAREVGSKGGSILFVGTKKQAADNLAQEAMRAGMPYVNQRWLGGTLTNFRTIRSRARYLQDLEGREARGELNLLPKKEALLLRRELTKLNNRIGGLKDMQEIGKLHDLDVSVVERFAVADTDMTSQLNKMKAAGVDAIAVWAQGTPTGQMMRSMEKINWFPPVLSSWAADNITFYDAAGKSLAEKPIFMRTMVDPSTPKQKELFERVKGKLAASSAFTFTVHGYDAVQLVAASIRQAGGTDGEKMRAALEDLKDPVPGAMKTYVKPFSKTQHEALTASDFAFVKWSDGKLVQITDGVVKSLGAGDFKR